MELYAAVRLAVVDEGLSHHEAGRRFGIDRRTVKKMLNYSAPPGYRRTKPVRRPKLDGFTGIIDAILEADTDPDVPRKQPASLSASPSRRSAPRNRTSPPSDEISPPSKSAVTFLRRTAGRSNGSRLSSVMVGVALSANITETPATLGISVGRWR